MDERVKAPNFPDEISLVEVLNILVKRRRTVIGVPVIAAFLAVGISFLVRPKYTGTTSFVPEARSQGTVPTGLAGLAGQFGIAIGTGGSESPEFYADVATSRGILNRLLLGQYANPRGTSLPGDSAPLLHILRAGGRNGADSLERAARKLAGLLSVHVDDQTSIVTMNATLPYPELAAAVANRLVTYLNEFNTETRQSQARERRRFTEQRVAAGDQDLREAEEALKRFYEANRSWQQSPQLVFEEGQLHRQVELRQELDLTLRREYEGARIEEVNDTPVITVIDTAIVPQRKSSPKRKLWGLVAFALAGVIAVFWSFGAEYVQRASSENDQSYRALERTVAEMRDSLARMVRRLLPARAKEDQVRRG
jgi:uncharacterized protein involved in exopolysaccharide biosynthesis